MENKEAQGKKDATLERFKQRGFVPQGCTLGGDMILVEIMLGSHPCDGCNVPRETCGGRPKKRGNPFAR